MGGAGVSTRLVRHAYGRVYASAGNRTGATGDSRKRPLLVQ